MTVKKALATTQINAAAIVPERAIELYRETMQALQRHRLPFLVGGAHALAQYTGITRHTKDLDLFVKGEDVKAMLRVLEAAGFETELTSPMWLAKARQGENFVDFIFNSSNGLCHVDDFWFERAPHARIFDVDVQLCAPEEILWSKAFVVERERYDGADIAHLLRASAERIDWQRLIGLFNGYWRVLLAHLLMFEFIYPGDAHRIPREVMSELLERAQRVPEDGKKPPNVCRGTLLSRTQYLHDIKHWEYEDARVRPHGRMTAAEAAILSLLEDDA